MSSPDPEVVRELLKAEGAKDGGYTRLSRALGGTPTRQALQSFADGDTPEPRYLGRLWRMLNGEPDRPPVAEEAARALALIREGEAVLARLAERLRDDDAESIAAADAPLTPSSPAGATPAARRASARR